MHESNIDLLKAHNLSVTPVRLALLKVLAKHPHTDAEQIFRAVKKLIATTSKQTIYNALQALVENGLIREIKPKGRPSLYETRVGDNHHHLVCLKCKLVMDTNCSDSAPCLTPTDSHGFALQEAEIIFWGTCPTCQTTQKGERYG